MGQILSFPDIIDHKNSVSFIFCQGFKPCFLQTLQLATILLVINMISIYPPVVACRIDAVAHQFQHNSESVPMQVLEVNKRSFLALPSFVKIVRHFSLLLQQVSHLLFVGLIPEAKEATPAQTVRMHYFFSIEVSHADCLA